MLQDLPPLAPQRQYNYTVMESACICEASHPHTQEILQWLHVT